MRDTLDTCLEEPWLQSRRCAEQGHWDGHGDLEYGRRLEELSLFLLQ